MRITRSKWNRIAAATGRSPDEFLRKDLDTVKCMFFLFPFSHSLFLFILSLYSIYFKVTRSVEAVIRIVFPASPRLEIPTWPQRIQRRRQSEPAPQPQPQPQSPQHRQRNSIARSRAQSGPQLAVWCYCRRPDFGSLMYRCDNWRCATKWFHQECIDEPIDANDQWFCQNCR